MRFLFCFGLTPQVNQQHGTTGNVVQIAPTYCAYRLCLALAWDGYSAMPTRPHEVQGKHLGYRAQGRIDNWCYGMIYDAF
jgi:hypothetical protein